jgi:hypothetical protein
MALAGGLPNGDLAGRDVVTGDDRPVGDDLLHETARSRTFASKRPTVLAREVTRKRIPAA